MRIIDTPPEVYELLARGETLPTTWYTDPAIFMLEQDIIFARSWQYVGLVSEAPNPGDYFTHRVGRIPVIVVRDEEGVIRTFVNVCRHRGAELVQEGCGHRMTLQCPYHAWTYRLDGSLKKAPRSERNAHFDPEGIALVSLRTETLGPLIFVNPHQEAAPVADVFGGWLERVSQAGIDLSATLQVHVKHDYQVEANWKVVCENAFECYHCPTCHPGLAAATNVDPDFWFESYDTFTVFGFPPEESPEKGFKQDAVLTCLFPNFFPVLRREGFIAALQILPLDAHASISHREYWFAEDIDEGARKEFMTVLDEADLEDVAITSSVQRGLRSGFFEHGRLLLPSTEAGVHSHQHMVYRALRKAPYWEKEMLRS